MSFQEKRWYRVRLSVTEEEVAAWIDDEQIVDVPRADPSFGIRSEMGLCRPFGIASWRTTAAVRDIRLRQLEAGNRLKQSFRRMHEDVSERRVQTPDEARFGEG